MKVKLDRPLKEKLSEAISHR